MAASRIPRLLLGSLLGPHRRLVIVIFTLIVIAHRISSALRAQRILVLDGAQPQFGDHATLLVISAMYQDLVGYWKHR